jgi:HPt (histidine-containing phosphotransfer) domain-containing protein
LQDYAITIHGLKSASGSIGAEDTMEEALRLELMAKSGNLSEVLSRNLIFLKDTENLLTGIQAWLRKLDSKYPKPQLLAPDRNLLASLRQSCERYDMDGIEKAMEELEKAKYEIDAPLIAWLREKIDILDLSVVAARLAEYEKELW